MRQRRPSIMYTTIYFVNFVEIDIQNINEYLQQQKIPMVDTSQKFRYSDTGYPVLHR